MKTLVKDKDTGKFVSFRYPTPKLRAGVKKMMDEGKDDTEIARWLMWDMGVKLWMAARLIQKEKKLRKLVVDKQH